MAFFDDLTTSLKQKWLQFYQVNRSWLTQHMEEEFVKTPDGGKRPPSYLILGVANALEPQLGGLMLPFYKLNRNVDALIDALDLNFDPDQMLANGFNPTASQSSEVAAMPPEPTYNVTVIETATVAEPDQMSDVSLDDTYIEEVLLMEPDDESTMVMGVSEPDDEMSVILVDDTADNESMGVMNVSELDELNDLLRDDIGDESLETSTTDELDVFGNMSLDEMADIKVESDNESREQPSTGQSNESGNRMSNLWGQEPLPDPKRSDDKQSKQDQEISRLFPNF
jgi:hypothetical protein